MFQRCRPQFHAVGGAQCDTHVIGEAVYIADGLGVSVAVADNETAQGVGQESAPERIGERTGPVGGDAIAGNPIMIQAAELRPIRGCSGKREQEEQKPNATSSWDFDECPVGDHMRYCSSSTNQLALQASYLAGAIESSRKMWTADGIFLNVRMCAVFGHLS